MATSKNPSVSVELDAERVTKGGWAVFSTEDDGAVPARNIYVRKGSDVADAKKVKVTIEKVS